MNTYGFQSIHGRGLAVATGVKGLRPYLDVWVVTGDGDGLSIGGNHFFHTLRKNINIKILLFNNRIYGLTKGQYSPTSEFGKKTKSSPAGSIDYPVNTTSFALGAESTFVARTSASDPVHMGKVLEQAGRHKGVSMVEILQNCVIFNDAAFEAVDDRQVRSDNVLFLEEGKPLIFGKELNKGIRMLGGNPEVITFDPKSPPADLLVHNPKHEQSAYAFLLSRMDLPEFPVPMGIFRSVEKPTLDFLLHAQVEKAKKAQGEGELKKIFEAGETWTIA
jgi:2-oxoglutarate ferredoxin oxidoreductase subunit beta